MGTLIRSGTPDVLDEATQTQQSPEWRMNSNAVGWVLLSNPSVRKPASVLSVKASSEHNLRVKLILTVCN